ncbi:serine peptidase [Streptomyces sp. NPDC004609]|uniref:serine peptidase n=1 Tax=Streptomyces sp. NPDC004609 TaxID=3364704 RepID=UPI003681DC4D
MRILGVHGVGNHYAGATSAEARAKLAATWTKNLARGPFGASVRECDLAVAYYADLLREPGGQSIDEVTLEELGPEAEALMRLWLDEQGLPEEVPQGWATWPLRQALAWVAARDGLAPSMVEAFVARFFAEVATYLGEPDGRPRADAGSAVALALTEHTPRVVIAHSLGSVVAYEALWAHRGAPVDLLVTLGSPLALPHAVFPRLLPAPVQELGSRPPSVRRWVNISDVGDLVAIPKGGVARAFTGVSADHHDSIHAFDFHLAANYLRCDPLARILREELARPVT